MAGVRQVGVSSTGYNHTLEILFVDVLVGMSCVRIHENHLVLGIDTSVVGAAVRPSLVATSVHGCGLGFTHASSETTYMIWCWCCLMLQVEHGSIILDCRLSCCCSNAPWHMHQVHRSTSISALVLISKVRISICVQLEVFLQFILLMEQSLLMNVSRMSLSHISRKMLLHVDHLSHVLHSVAVALGTRDTVACGLPDVVNVSRDVILGCLVFEYIVEVELGLVWLTHASILLVMDLICHVLLTDHVTRLVLIESL